MMVDPGAAGSRLDVFLTGQESSLSRSRVQGLISGGMVTVNGRVARSNYRVKSQDQVAIQIPPPAEIEALPEAISLDILYEDSDLIVINKPQGMVVHPGAGNLRGTLVNALLDHCRDLSGINGKLRPGIVHRIDKETSGVLVAAKNDFAHINLAAQLKAHTVTRVYVALVHGRIREDAGTVDAPIGRHPVHRQKMAVVAKSSRRATTHFRVLERYTGCTLIEARLETGRTHQIRVHLSYLGHPVVGDARYGPGRRALFPKGHALHARVLGFHHPRSGQYMEFSAPLPSSFMTAVERLRRAAEGPESSTSSAGKS